MTTFSKLTFAVLVPIFAVWAIAAPPRVTGNRPVVIEVPIPEGDAVFPEQRPEQQDQDLLAFLFPDDPAEADSDEGDLPAPTTVLNQARKQLLKYTSVSARLVETVAVLERSFKAEGRYLQTALKTNDWHMRLEMAVKVGDSTGSLLEICDGSILWTRTDIESGRRKERKEGKETLLLRRNVTEIMAAARKLGDQRTETALMASFGLGGIPGLIAGIEQDMKFSSVREDTLSERPVYVVEGTWSEAFLQKAHRPGTAPMSILMLPTVPDAIRIYVDRETGFPHRFAYLKKVPGRNVQRPLLTLDFLDVVLNEPIDADEFSYKEPEGVPVVEQTKMYVEYLTPRDTQAQPAAPSSR